MWKEEGNIFWTAERNSIWGSGFLICFKKEKEIRTDASNFVCQQISCPLKSKLSLGLKVVGFQSDGQLGKTGAKRGRGRIIISVTFH